MTARFRSLTLLAIFSLLTVPLLAQNKDTTPEAGAAVATKGKPKDPAFDQVTDEAGLPRVLIIGDSISIGYTKVVQAKLKGKANVHRIPENGNATGIGQEKLEVWLGKEKWDVIHFNWGLHDLKHWKNGKLDLAGPQVTPVEQYEKNLRDLVTKMKASGAKLIWASTTQVPEGSGGRVEGDEAAYNAAAKRVMDEAKVPTDDLHAFLTARITELQLPHNVHFSKAGYEALGEKVAESIEKELPKK